VLYLLPYSSDLNPIEKLWSKVKAMSALWTLLSQPSGRLSPVFPVTIVPPGYAVLVIAYFETCSSFDDMHATISRRGQRVATQRLTTTRCCAGTAT